MANFVLVHGSFHGGWCWKPVVDRLEALGHRVLAPSLSGLAERRDELSDRIDLYTHVEDIVEAVRAAELNQFVLCGHSYGGMVITGVAERLVNAIAGIVYLDALIPEDAQSAADIYEFEAPAQLALSPVAVEMFAIADPKLSKWVSETMSPQPVRTLTQKLRVTGAYKRIPRKIHVAGTRVAQAPHELPGFHKSDTSINPVRRINERLSREPGWTTVSADTGHHVMLDDPDLVVALLVLAACAAPTA